MMKRSVGNVSWNEAPVDEPVTMINVFSVPLEETEPFLRRWRTTNARIMSEQPGFIRALMYQTVADDQMSFINTTHWESGAALTKARANPAWLASTKAMLNDPELHVTARPGVYTVAIELQPAGTTTESTGD